MVDNCKHVLKLSPASDHSVLNPQNWACKTCATTESVWACLSCPHVACGRYIEEHALQHYHQTKHPLSLEVNEQYVFCYECNDYVLNDNAAGDVKILRNALSAVTSQSMKGVSREGKRLLRSRSQPFMGYSSKVEKQLTREDRNYTALWFRRYYQMAKAFSAWKQAAGIKKKEESSDDCTTDEDAKVDGTLHSPSKKRVLTPGITGLRNLGNTCYMNSVLQVLRYLLSYSHLRDFREFFLRLKDNPSPKSSPSSSAESNNSERRKKQLLRQTTMECFKHVTEFDKKGGLSGGGSVPSTKKLLKLARTKENMDNVSLCHELHALLRVMWSGKWAMVSPHKMLYAVWNIIPFFRGYSQQDAQEFLCAFLNEVSSELEVSSHLPPEMPSTSSAPSTPSGASNHLPQTFQDVVSRLFQGQLVSELTCLRCKTKSHTYEPFMDLSLEFPNQTQDTKSSKISTKPCHLEDMLAKFTAVEKLDGKIYACTVCNTSRRRAASPRPTQHTEAQKRFTLHRLPHVLRLHLKRFMWSGRNNRGKITVHAQFEQMLDLKPFCHSSLEADTYMYELSAVVMHHGRGFGSGHYTAYCWNEEGDSWVHCNDANMQAVSSDKVMKAQAYILFYTRQKVDIPDKHLAVPLNANLFERVDEEITFNFKNSSIPRFRELKRKLSQGGAKGQRELKRRKSNIF